MRPKLDAYRIAGLVTAFVGISLMIFFYYHSVRGYDEFEGWLEDRPMQLAVDLSKPGEYTAPFRQTCGSAHATTVLLEVRPQITPCLEPRDALESLRAQIVIKRKDGSVVETTEIDTTRIYADGDDLPLVLTSLPSFATGEYTATVLVESGSPELAEKQQSLFVRYQLCGMERLTADLAGAAAVLAGLIGVPTLIVILPRLIRHGLREVAPRKSAENEATLAGNTEAGDQSGASG